MIVIILIDKNAAEARPFQFPARFPLVCFVELSAAAPPSLLHRSASAESRAARPEPAHSLQAVPLCCLDSGVLFDHQTATVVSAFAADGVIDVPCATVGAMSDCRHLSLVVSTALRSACLRLFAFRMCHRFLSLFYFVIRFWPAVSRSLLFVLFTRRRQGC